jgi:hypothetical protein
MYEIHEILKVFITIAFVVTCPAFCLTDVNMSVAPTSKKLKEARKYFE